VCAKRGEVRGKSWWICGESVVGNDTKSTAEKYANFFKFILGWSLAKRDLSQPCGNCARG
jgi:hypothetical protein